METMSFLVITSCMVDTFTIEKDKLGEPDMSIWELRDKAKEIYNEMHPNDPAKVMQPMME